MISFLGEVSGILAHQITTEFFLPGSLQVGRICGNVKLLKIIEEI